MPGGNIIIGHNSGNVGNSGTCMSVQEEEPAGHQVRPNGPNINYTNVEIHIGLFGGQIKLPDHKRVRPHRLRQLMVCIAAVSLACILSISTPTESRHEQTHPYSTEESTDRHTIPEALPLTCDTKQRRKKL